MFNNYNLHLEGAVMFRPRNLYLKVTFHEFSMFAFICPRIYPGFGGSNEEQGGAPRGGLEVMT